MVVDQTHVVFLILINPLLVILTRGVFHGNLRHFGDIYGWGEMAIGGVIRSEIACVRVVVKCGVL